MREESMNGGSTRRLAGGEWSAVGKSDAKGKEDSAIRSFYSRRRRGGGGWRRAQTSASTTDIEAVRRQQRRAIECAHPLSRRR
jgi:hypothetical protein